MEAVSPHSFTIDLSEPDNSKPLPYSLGRGRPRGKVERIKQIDYYPKFEIEFYDIVKSCAEYIDRFHDVKVRLEYTKQLNRLFVTRNKLLAMKLFSELVNAKIKEVNSHEKSS